MSAEQLRVGEQAAVWIGQVIAAAPPAAAERLRSNPALAAALFTGWQRARAAWPECPLGSAAFAAHVGARLPDDGDDATIAALAIDDLVLACACVLDLRGAFARLRDRHAADVRRGLGRVPDDRPVDEVVAGVLQHIGVGDGVRGPRLLDYRGRGPLGRWISVVARRLAVDRSRTRRGDDDVLDDGAMAAAYGDPELAAMKQGTRDAFRAALEQAAAALRPRDRNLLRYAFVHRLGVAEIAGIYRVSVSTARRQLAKVREDLVADVRSRLCHALGLGAVELERELAEMDSAIAVTLSRILRPPR